MNVFCHNEEITGHLNVHYRFRAVFCFCHNIYMIYMCSLIWQEGSIYHYNASILLEQKESLRFRPTHGYNVAVNMSHKSVHIGISVSMSLGRSEVAISSILFIVFLLKDVPMELVTGSLVPVSILATAHPTFPVFWYGPPVLFLTPWYALKTLVTMTRVLTSLCVSHYFML